MARTRQPAGPGRPPKDPYAIVDYRQVETPDGDVRQEPVRVIDRIIEAMRQNGFIHDAAGRAGIAVETLRQWRRKGADANADLLAGKCRLGDLDQHTRRCIELWHEMERAESDARLSLLTVTTASARGGIPVRETVERINVATGEVIDRTVRTRRTAPDTHAATWLLSRRYPADFAGRVSVTGADGGPVKVEVSPRAELQSAIDAIIERRALAPNGRNGHEPAAVGPPNGANGNE